MNEKTDMDYLNYNDLNEVEAKIDQLTEEISKVVKSIPIYNKKTWILNELPFIQEIDRIEKAIYNLGEYYIEPKGWQTLKKWITDDNLYPIKSFDYRDWNRWINNLNLIDTSEISNMTLWDGNSLINWNEISDINWIDNNEILIKGKIIELLNKFKIIIKYLKLNGYTKQNVYSGKNKNVRAEEVKAGSSNVANAFTNLTEYDVYKNVVEVSSSVAWMTLNTNGMSPDFYEKVKTGGFDVTTMLLIKKTNSNTTIKFYLGSITGGAVYNELKHYKDEENGWAWYYTTHTIPTSPRNTTINNHINSLATNFGTFYIAKIQTLIGNTPSDFEPYTGGQPSPNPDYPQEIEVATGSVSAKSTGKNLYVSSNDIPTGYYAGGVKDVENMHDGDVSIKTANAWSGVFFNLKELIANNNLKVGDKVTCSIYFKTNFTPTWNLTFTLYRATLAGSSETITISPSEVVVGEWRRLSFSFEINEYSLTSERARIETNYYDRDDPYYFGNNRENYMWFASPQFEVGELTDYEPYKESTIIYNLGDNFLADKDYIENGVLNKNIRHLRLAIADMNNNDNYPGWKNVPYIGKDYPNQNNKLSDFCNYKSNITNTYAALNSLGGGSNLILFKTLFGGLTQTEIKEQYPDLILDLYYEMPQTEQIQLETTGELRTFEPNTIITNSLDSQMEIGYIEEVK